MSRPDTPPDFRAALTGLKARIACELRAGLRLAGGQDCRQAPPAAETLESIRRDLGSCSRCGLCAKRNEIVFGAGSHKAGLVFVGLAPSAADDAAGQPFSDEEGELLTKIIQSIQCTRRDVYLTHILKCAPPGGRPPLPEEIAACLPFLLRQLSAIGPALVCALGQTASQVLLETELPLEELRGRFHPFREFLLMPTHDPCSLILHPQYKRQTWDDMKLIMQECARRAN